MQYVDCFSGDYKTARERFRSTAAACGARLTEYRLEGRGPQEEELSIDVAVLGDVNSQKALVVSSGVHGVEGFFGSAVQLAWLKQAQDIEAARGRIILIHAVNPYGFARRRRWCEDNVDLNRNWLTAAEDYRGSPQLYAALDGWLNPKTPPRRWEPFLPGAAGIIVRRGMAALKTTLPVGQYEFPQGLFFGGGGAAPSHRLVDEKMCNWLGKATDVLHLDFHTGIGRWATYKLLIHHTTDSSEAEWFAAHFGSGNVSAAPAADQTGPQPVGYETRGSWDRWCTRRFDDRTYRFATAEFGTYSPLRVVAALRAENRAHHWPATDGDYEWTKLNLVEAFAPASRNWRNKVVRRGLEIVGHGVKALFH